MKLNAKLLLPLPLPFDVHLPVRLDFERIRCEVIYAANMTEGTSRGAEEREDVDLCEFIKCEHCQIAVVRLT